jgi:hypothetical protein
MQRLQEIAPGILVATAEFATTTSTVVLGDDGVCLVIDPAVLVPGHGHVADSGEFRRRLDADRHYLDLLAAGQPFDDPRCTVAWQREHHDAQLRVVADQD